MSKIALPCLALGLALASAACASAHDAAGWRLIPEEGTTGKIAIPSSHDGFVMTGKLYNIAMLDVLRGQGVMAVLIPGTNQDSDRYDRIAREMEKQGIATVVVQFRQHACRDTNTCASVTPDKIRDDVSVLLAWAEKYAVTPVDAPRPVKCLIAVSHADGSAYVPAATAKGTHPSAHINLTDEDRDGIYVKVGTALYEIGCGREPGT